MQTPVEYLSHFGDDLMVANAARVSMAVWHPMFTERDERLIHYLAREKHWTPFGHPQIHLRITAPIAIARQLFRSTVGTVRSETSRRYVDKPPTYFTPQVWRSRPPNNIKQGSGEPLSEEAQDKITHCYNKAVRVATECYTQLLGYGVAPEQARFALPQATETQWVETGSLAYWARIYELRNDHHAQVEVQDYAHAIAAIIDPLFPVSWAALTRGHTHV